MRGSQPTAASLDSNKRDLRCELMGSSESDRAVGRGVAANPKGTSTSIGVQHDRRICCRAVHDLREPMIKRWMTFRPWARGGC